MLHQIQTVHKTRFKLCDSIVTDKGVTIPCISGQVGAVDIVSPNGYRYKTEFWDQVLSDPIIATQIAAREMRGTIEHPEDDAEFLCTSYENTSHIVFKAWVQNHQPFATFGIANNPKGNAIKSLLDLGATMGVSTRGMGQFGNDQVSKFVDSKDYLLITWDIVKNPNFGDLRMAPVTDSLRQNSVFKELCDMHQIKDSAYRGYNKDALIADMSAAINELQKKFEVLKSL